MIPGGVWRSPREKTLDHIRYAAIVSYTTGFFTFNADRKFACFALASYALYGEQNHDRLIEELDKVRLFVNRILNMIMDNGACSSPLIFLSMSLIRIHLVHLQKVVVFVYSGMLQNAVCNAVCHAPMFGF